MLRFLVALLAVTSPAATMQCIPDTFRCGDGLPSCCSGVCTGESCEPLPMTVPEHARHHDDYVAFRERHALRSFPAPPFTQGLVAYAQNARLASQLNDAIPGAEFSAMHSPFGDMTTDQFREQVLMRPHAPPDVVVKRQPNGATQDHLAAIPEQVDWNKNGAVSSVKDQGSLGTCWAFSCVGNIEGQVGIAGGTVEDLSVEQLVECDNTFNSSAKIADCGEFGGWPYMGFEYLAKVGGIYAEKDFPYCAGVVDKKTLLPECFPCMASKYSKSFCGDHGDLYCKPDTTLGQGQKQMCKNVDRGALAAKVSGWRAISPDEDEIKREVAHTGPLSVALNAGLLQLYKKGVFNPPKWLCSPKTLDHAVLLTGYGVVSEDESWELTASQRRRLGAKAPKEYWILKNSWGPKWGEQGFFRMSRGMGTCGVNTAVATSILG